MCKHVFYELCSHVKFEACPKNCWSNQRVESRPKFAFCGDCAEDQELAERQMALQAQQTAHRGGGAGTGANLHHGHAVPPVNHPTLPQHGTGWENHLTGKREQAVQAPSLATTPGTMASYSMPVFTAPPQRAPPATHAEKVAKLQALRGGNPRRHPGLPAHQGHASTQGAQTRKDTEQGALQHEVLMPAANERYSREQQARNQDIIAKFGTEAIEREERKRQPRGQEVIAEFGAAAQARGRERQAREDQERRARGQEIIAKFKAEVEARDERERETAGQNVLRMFGQAAREREPSLREAEERNDRENGEIRREAGEARRQRRVRRVTGKLPGGKGKK